MTSVPARALPPQDGTVEVLHGVSVADPFRPLERADDLATVAWVDGEDALARAALAALPGRDAMTGFLRAIWDYPKASVPERHGARWFHWFNDGLAAQFSYAVQAAP